MRRHRKPRVLLFVVFGIAAAIIVSQITMELWNWLIPSIFGLPSITVSKALGLLLLSRLFFGGFGGRGGRCWGRRGRFVRGWDSLTPEERERFRAAMTPEQRERMRNRCGGFDAPETAPAAESAPRR
jgi:hypothetical protein